MTARRTVDEAELVEVADEMKQFVVAMNDALAQVADGLIGLRQTWAGIGFDAFLDRVQHWQRWAAAMGQVVSDMQVNAHIAHHNYMHNAQVNTEMWGAWSTEVTTSQPDWTPSTPMPGPNIGAR